MAKTKPVAQKLVRSRKGTTEVFKISLTGKNILWSLGSTYDNPKQRSKTPSTPEKARAAYDAMIAEKRREGFRELGEVDAPTVPIARDERLEAAIRADRDDASAYMVYADWLLGQGCPLGEAIGLAQRNKKKAADAIVKQIGMPGIEMATVEWRHGFWKSLRLDNTIDWEDEDWDPVPFARALFGSPLCAVLEELKIAMLRWSHQDQPKVIAEAGRHAWANDLRSLHVGDVDDNIDMDHHTIGDVGKTIAKSFPNLVALRLHSGSQSWRAKSEMFGIAGLELPKLESLVVETCALTGKRLKSLLAFDHPALASLELWFGDPDRNTIAKLADVKPILDGKYPKLRRLGLRNTVLCTDLVRLLPTSKVAKQLEALDLSMGTFHDDDAAELVSEAKAFPALRTLDVTDSYLTKAGITTLKKGFPKVEVRAKDQREMYEYDDGRYVAVGE